MRLFMKALNRRIESSPSSVNPTDLIESSCLVSWFRRMKSFCVSKILSREKAPKFITFLRSTCEYLVSTMLRLLFIAFISSFAALISALLTRSTLFKRTTSASAICCKASLTAPFCLVSLSLFTINFASATVTIPSSLNAAETSELAKNVCATGAGSANPVVSMITPSKFFPLSFKCFIFASDLTRSPLVLQQIQPLLISTTSSFSSKWVCTNLSSTPTHPYSFSMTAYFFSFCSFKM
mmetsp:Transcript_2214/g.3197  ORF Transcript_2214/g.3197 Transcript_2214/m.3197 type:complete len:238 (-) Transcript_2214:870-1583(-)